MRRLSNLVRRLVAPYSTQLLQSWICARQGSLSARLIKHLCRVMDWPVFVLRVGSLAFTLIEHPKMGLAWSIQGQHDGPGGPSLCVHASHMEPRRPLGEHAAIHPLPFIFWQRIRATTSLVANIKDPDIQDRLLGLPDGVSLVLSDSIPLTGHQYLAVQDVMPRLAGSTGIVVHVPDLTPATGADTVFFLFRQGDMFAVVSAPSRVLLRLNAEPPCWADVLDPTGLPGQDDDAVARVRGIAPVGIFTANF